MNTYHQAIAALEADLATMDRRRGAIVTALESLRAIDGDVAAPTPAAAPVRTSTPRASTPRRSTRTTESRGSEHGTSTRERVLAALRAIGRPVSPGEIAGQLGLEPGAVGYHLKGLLQSGQVTAAGVSNARRYALAAGSATAGTPAAPGTGPAPAAPLTEEQRVEARDAAITARLRQGRATFDQVLDAMPKEGLSPDDARQACMKALRRLALRRKVIDVGDRYQLVA